MLNASKVFVGSTLRAKSKRMAQVVMLILTSGAGCGSAPVEAGKATFRYPEGRHGKGELMEVFHPRGESEAGNAVAAEPQSALCVPLTGGGTTYGVIYLGSSVRRLRFDEADLQRLLLIELVRVQANPRAERRLEKPGVRGCHAVPAKCMEIRGEQLRLIESSAGDRLPSLAGHDLAVDLMFP